MSDMLNNKVNQWTPRRYADMTPTEREAAREGFEAGRQYEASLRDNGPSAEVFEGPCMFEGCPHVGTDHTHQYIMTRD